MPISRSQKLTFDPESIQAFQFTYRRLEPDGTIRLGYALDDIEFQETFALPYPTVESPAVTGLLDLLHWVAGISYYKAAIPEHLVCETGAPWFTAGDLLGALYSEGLGEFAVRNELDRLPHPQFPRGIAGVPAGEPEDPRRLLIPVGGGKDSIVALEIARRSGLDAAVFALGDAAPILRTAEASGLPFYTATRAIDPRLLELNNRGALNGHIPITAIVSCVALLTAATQGFDTVAMANERSASAGNFMWNGVEINHQFSKGRQAEKLLSKAVSEIPDAPRIFSLLRPASELSIARAFAKLTGYHEAFTSCNRLFHLDPDKRRSSWCCECDKCRFVYLALAPFMTPEQLTTIFGKDLLADPEQYDGFALLTATGGEKPFECVGEVGECLAAIRLLSESEAWRDHVVVKRLTDEVLAKRPVSDADLAAQFALSDDHDVPDTLIGSVREVLGA